MSTIDESEVQDFWAIIAAAGYSESDFQLAETDLNRHVSGIYPLSGQVVVHRKTVKISRNYVAGDRSTWLNNFERELIGGVYGPP